MKRREPEDESARKRHDSGSLRCSMGCPLMHEAKHAEQPACIDADKLASRLERLADGDTSARDEILELCQERLRVLSHRLLGKFPGP